MTREVPIDAACERLVMAAMHGKRRDAVLALAQAAAWGAASPQHRAGLWRWVAEQAPRGHFTSLPAPLDAVSAPDRPRARSEVMR